MVVQDCLFSLEAISIFFNVVFVKLMAVVWIFLTDLVINEVVIIIKIIDIEHVIVVIRCAWLLVKPLVHMLPLRVRLIRSHKVLISSVGRLVPTLVILEVVI